MPAVTLCADCGICCDGGLFSSVSLEAEGLVAARKHHLPVVETASGDSKFLLPCPALRGVLCAIYDERPECCADFSCELLIQLDEEEVTADEAREIIAATRAARERVSDVIGDTPWWTARRTALDAQRDNSSAHDEELLADLNALEELIRVHFWG